MPEKAYKYVIIGGGLAGSSAADAIREVDKDGMVLLIANEDALPYHRPPLSKGLWFGKKKPHEIFTHDKSYYSSSGIDVLLETIAVSVSPHKHVVSTSDGQTFGFEKLLLATGGVPRKLLVPGALQTGLVYYRYISDFHFLKDQVQNSTKILVVGGGFIGSEMSAALNHAGADVTLLNRDEHIGARIFPHPLAESIEADYVNRGIKLVSGDQPIAFEETKTGLTTHTRSGRHLESEIVVIGAGIEPETKLAQSAGLAVSNGVVVNEFLQTSHPDVYAAGDNALFPYQALDSQRRVEHWDNALNQGRYAGLNMAGQRESYDYMPYFFSDLFDFGYEAVGNTNTALETFSDWEIENKKGTIYYLDNSVVVGVMLCDIWGQVDAARDLIRQHKPVSKEQLRHCITAQK